MRVASKYIIKNKYNTGGLKMDIITRVWENEGHKISITSAIHIKLKLEADVRDKDEAIDVMRKIYENRTGCSLEKADEESLNNFGWYLSLLFSEDSAKESITWNGDHFIFESEGSMMLGADTTTLQTFDELSGYFRNIALNMEVI